MNAARVRELVQTLEHALEAERDALLDGNAEGLLDASGSKLQCLNDLSEAQRTRAAALQAFHPRLRQAMVANARNQALLAMLRSRVESRMQDLGLLGATYDRSGRHAARLTTRAVAL